MSEIYAKPIVTDKLWIIEKNGEKVGTLQKQENNKFMFCNHGASVWFSKQDELNQFFGNDFFLFNDKLNIKPSTIYECNGFLTKSIAYNAMYDIRKKLSLYTKQPHSTCFHCAGWFLVKFKNWVILDCPKLVTVEKYESHGPFYSKKDASNFKCTIK